MCFGTVYGVFCLCLFMFIISTIITAISIINTSNLLIVIRRDTLCTYRIVIDKLLRIQRAKQCHNNNK